MSPLIIITVTNAPPIAHARPYRSPTPTLTAHLHLARDMVNPSRKTGSVPRLGIHLHLSYLEALQIRPSGLIGGGRRGRRGGGGGGGR